MLAQAVRYDVSKLRQIHDIHLLILRVRSSQAGDGAGEIAITASAVRQRKSAKQAAGPEKPAAAPAPASITPPAGRPASPAASTSPKAAAAAATKAQPTATASNNTWGALTLAGVLYIGAPLLPQKPPPAASFLQMAICTVPGMPRLAVHVSYLRCSGCAHSVCSSARLGSGAMSGIRSCLLHSSTLSGCRY